VINEQSMLQYALHSNTEIKIKKYIVKKIPVTVSPPVRDAQI